MVRQGHLTVVVVPYLIGCAVLLLAVRCTGTPSEPSKEEQGRSPEPTSEEQARCQGTRTYHGPSFLTFHPEDPGIVYTTNDIPGCPSGGLLSGTDKPDQLGGKDGDDEIRGLGDKDYIYGGSGDDVIHGGPGDESLLYGGKGEDVLYGDDGNDELIDGSGNDVIFCPGRDVVEGCGSLGVGQSPPAFRGLGHDDRFYGEPDGADVIYGGDGNDFIAAYPDGQRDKLYCGKGKDLIDAQKPDYVDSSCEKYAEFSIAHIPGPEGLPERSHNTTERYYRHGTGAM
jgi:hypothetical protein